MNKIRKILKRNSPYYLIFGSHCDYHVQDEQQSFLKHTYSIPSVHVKLYNAQFYACMFVLIKNLNVYYIGLAKIYHKL